MPAYIRSTELLSEVSVHRSEHRGLLIVEHLLCSAGGYMEFYMVCVVYITLDYGAINELTLPMVFRFNYFACGVVSIVGYVVDA